MTTVQMQLTLTSAPFCRIDFNNVRQDASKSRKHLISRLQNGGGLDQHRNCTVRDQRELIYSWQTLLQWTTKLTGDIRPSSTALPDSSGPDRAASLIHWRNQVLPSTLSWWTELTNNTGEVHVTLHTHFKSGCTINPV